MNQILLIGPFPNPIHGCSLANQVLENGLNKKNVKTDRINMATNFSEEIGSFSFKKAFAAIKQYFYIYKVFKVDVVYLTPGQSFFGVLKYAPFLLLSRLLGKQIVFHVHGNHLWKEFEQSSKTKKKIMRFLISLSSKGIVLSDSLRKNLIPFLPDEKIFSVFNFSEDYLHGNVDKSFDALRVVYLSNLMTTKGIFDLLSALDELKTRGISFNVKLAGAIPPETAEGVKSAISELGHDVEYVGVVRGQDKKDLLVWGNVFVFPTYYHSEGQPISLLEAMATGNAIVTTRHAGIPDILTEQNAFFVDIQSPGQIAEVLASFNQNRECFEAKSKYNFQDSRQYTEESYVNKILEVIND